MKKQTFNANGMTILHMESQDRYAHLKEIAKLMANDDIVISGHTFFYDNISESFKSVTCYYPE